ncbi:MAG TPA: AarF/ABC1/UbiB kinase family protein [Vicinamibacteria bacterium]|jgi:predicted unusual protein kinase regulating ubiquinone biosynthesis (AarF/ABC1/UbiB family)
MALSLKTDHLARYRDIAVLLIKYGRSDLVKHAGLGDAVAEGEALIPVGEQSLPEQLAADLERLGPTYVKLGQVLSTRADLLPPAFLEALTRLQDKVEPFPFPEVEAIVTAELGVKISKAFVEFDKIPVAAASLGQVHRAVLRTGRPVAVKVQRPGIQERMLSDLEVLEEIAEAADAHTETGRKVGFTGMLEEFRKTLLRELDYRQESRNLETLAQNLADFDRIVVPAPVEDYTTSRVLTIEYVRGQKVTSLHPVVQLDLDGEVLAEQLFRAYLKQILVDGFVHADPHPGNVFLTEDDRIALLDLGMVARVTPSMQEKLLQVLIAISEGRADEAATAGLKIGRPTADFDEVEYRRQVADLVGQSQGARMEQIQVGKVVLAFARLCGQSGIRVPPELTLLGKTLLNLDIVGRTLDPHFDPNAAIRRYAAEITRQRMLKVLSPGHFLETALELKDFVQHLPGRVNRIMDLAASNSLQVGVDAIDEKVLIEGFQKIANRITLGLILAALIVGAAMLMRVETSFRIFGYPGLAMLCFIAAAGGGLTLVWNIVRSDLHPQEKPKKRT